MPTTGFSEALLEAFLSVLTFVISCWLISKPKETITTELTTHMIEKTQAPGPLEVPDINEDSIPDPPVGGKETEKPEDKGLTTPTSDTKELILNPSPNDKALGEGAAYAAGGAVVGAGVAATVGGMGLAVGGTAVGIGVAPIVAAGTVAGLALSGAKKAIDQGDATALGAVAGGAAIGAGISTVVGGMGLAVGGTAVAIGMAPVAAVGAVVGLAGYGLWKLGENRRFVQPGATPA